MKNSSWNLSEYNKRYLKQILPILLTYQKELEGELKELFFSSIFDNVHVLHPRRLAELNVEEVKSFLEFISSYSVDHVFDFGKKRAREGLSLKSILNVGLFLTNFCLNKFEKHDSVILESILNAIEIYKSEYVQGFCFESKKLTLQQQKELRQALSTALKNHRRDILVQKHAMDTSINAIVLSDLNGLVKYVNPAFQKLWKYPEDEKVVGAKVFDLIRCKEARDIFQKLKKNGSWHGELTVRTKDDQFFNVEMSVSVIQDDKGNVLGTMASFVDITQRKRLESQIRQAQKMEALGQLAGGITHDFNNLLAAMKGYLQLILLDVDEESQIFDDLKQVEMVVDRGSGLTRQLRYFVRESSGEYVPTDLNLLVEEINNILSHTFPLEIKIVRNLEKKLWLVNADPSQIYQVLMNLCVNARDAILEKIQKQSGSGSKNNSIIIQTNNIFLDEKSASRFLDAKPGQYVCLKIKDTGIGMTKRVRDKLFEPFFTTKTAKQGSGLGLSIIYGIIKKHHGFIDFQSEIHRGTMFEIYFPVSKSIAQTIEKEKGVVSARVSDKATVLVVDDEPQLISILSRILTRLGYKVIAANSGKTAVAIFEQFKDSINLVILDMIMPEMSGKQCFRVLKRIKPEIKVFINTGISTDESVQHLLEQGIEGIIEKPFDIFKLQEILKEALEK